MNYLNRTMLALAKTGDTEMNQRSTGRLWPELSDGRSSTTHVSRRGSSEKEQ
jgi:hypothetical protein